MKVDWKSCVRIGISVFLLYLCITYWPVFIDLLHNLLQAATPLLLGCVLAYAINILMSFWKATCSRDIFHAPLGDGVENGQQIRSLFCQGILYSGRDLIILLPVY